MIDRELFELCKEVYVKTGLQWDKMSATRNRWFTVNGNTVRTYSEEGRAVTPVYTSDYLLGKLPKSIGEVFSESWLMLQPIGAQRWAACYQKGAAKPQYDSWADTPLKALLKLTLALHEAGEL